MADIALSVASRVAQFLVAPVGRQCGYVIIYDRYVLQLEIEVEKLDHAREWVQHAIDQARNDMKPIKANVERWVKDAETVASNAHDLLEDHRKARNTCFHGRVLNPNARYFLGRKARMIIRHIHALIACSRFEKVYYENAPSGHVTGSADMYSSAGDRGNITIESRDSILEDIMNALDDKTLKVIGIYGPCGVGKTTLLKEVEKKLKNEKRLFHMIVKAQVSQTPDLQNIQDDIAYALDLNLNDVPSKVGRRDSLFRRLQRDPNEKVLIILDDLQAGLDLKAVGIPLKDESRGCKLLLSSRYKEVLEQKMHADRTFRLEGLNDDEAFMLFEMGVGDMLKQDNELKVIAAEMVKKLGGLPLLIISVARTLKHGDVSTWKNTLIKIDESNIEAMVKSSYHHLNSEYAKMVFGSSNQVPYLDWEFVKSFIGSIS